MPEYRVQRRDPARIARAVMRYQLLQPRVLVVALVVLVVVAALAAASSGGSAATLAVVFFVVVLGATIAFKRRQLERTLRARGYRVGTVIRTSFERSALTVATDVGTAHHLFADISGVRSVHGVVLLRMREARAVVALPAELVPPEQVALATDAITSTGRP